MKKTTTLEEMHFSGTHGASMTVRILEKRPGYDPDATLHTLEIDHGARISLPLGTAQMARYIGEAIVRTADRMEKQDHAGGKYPMFRRFDLSDVVSVRAELRLRPVYQHTTVRGAGSTGADLLGVDWLDEDDEVVHFKPLTPHHHHGASGSESRFTQDEVGLMLAEVIRRRTEAGQATDRIAIHPNHREFTTIHHRYVAPGADPEIIIAPSPAIISEIVYGLPEDADEHTIMTAIRTFYAIPGYRRNRSWREAFRDALGEHLGQGPADISRLIARAKAG
ncbi:hypothetical protein PAPPERLAPAPP_01770 [Brevundimonas phage vB_BpoS-Papperlapapp]|uniref:Uncharacterized protein n=1 Tax=Brevundimonas phage vB_BpoS-Kabachok TaxID=2948600 RepID=A0A9E7MQG6_9CAUD|nr:hypothetical protein KABACHOK_00140 [Brevundimonas phage vB_BpoS-Kabachok]USN15919.1 hypothetical protein PAPPERLAPAPP_01770 [Brevundimonas phage vB_BpoS-Papperlapapp]